MGRTRTHVVHAVRLGLGDLHLLLALVERLSQVRDVLREPRQLLLNLHVLVVDLANLVLGPVAELEQRGLDLRGETFGDGTVARTVDLLNERDVLEAFDRPAQEAERLRLLLVAGGQSRRLLDRLAHVDLEVHRSRHGIAIPLLRVADLTAELLLVGVERLDLHRRELLTLDDALELRALRLLRLDPLLCIRTSSVSE